MFGGFFLSAPYGIRCSDFVPSTSSFHKLAEDFG